MKIYEWQAVLRQRNAALYTSVWVCVLVAAGCSVGLVVDSREVMGVNTWLKPLKFSLSIAIYNLTLAWLLAYLPWQERQIVTWGTIACMAVELGLIVFQAARGVPSHFNISTPTNGLIFSVMGLFIVVNSLLLLYTLFCFFRRTMPLPPHQVWAWRLGLALAFLGGLSGGIMSATLGHSVGVAEGGPGLWFLNWSLQGGDWRVAHFFTLHGLQVIPAFVWIATDITGYLAPTRTTAWTVAVGYAGFCALLHLMALRGIPLFGG